MFDMPVEAVVNILKRVHGVIRIEMNAPNTNSILNHLVIRINTQTKNKNIMMYILNKTFCSKPLLTH